MNSISRQKSTTHRIRNLEYSVNNSSKRFDTEVIYFFREHRQVISVFLIDWSYSLVSAIVSVSISKIVWIFISIWYCNHSSHSRVFRYSIYLFSISTSVLCLRVELNIKSSKLCIRNIKNVLTKLFFSIRYSHHLSCLRIFQNHICLFSKSALIFDFCDEVNIVSIQKTHIVSAEFFSKHLIFESFYTLKKSFDNVSNFLANRLFSFAWAMTSEQQKSEISISNRCQWCHLNYETWNSHRLQYSSCDAQNQQAYEFVLQFLEEYTSEIIESSTVFALIISSISSEHQKQQKSQKSNALKIARKIKFNAVKNAKRVKSKALKVEQTAKSTSTFQNIDIFDSTFTCENRRFSDFANFLRYLRQCQSLYRKSDLLMLLLICLWNSAFDIWYDKQNVMCSASLNEWIEILRVDFANASFAKIRILKIICMRCDSSFNFKEKLREHVREQHAKKSISCSSFSIDTIKSVYEIEKSSTIIKALVTQASHILFTASRIQIAFEITSSKSSNLSTEALKVICETMKKSTVIDSSVSFVSQKLDIFAATSKHKFESVMIFEAINSSKNSHFTSSASETISELMENASTQCSSTSSRSSSFQMFESE